MPQLLSKWQVSGFRDLHNLKGLTAEVSTIWGGVYSSVSSIASLQGSPCFDPQNPMNLAGQHMPVYLSTLDQKLKRLQRVQDQPGTHETPLQNKTEQNPRTNTKIKERRKRKVLENKVEREGDAIQSAFSRGLNGIFCF